ncbi:MAG: hypothetical protein ACT4TC_19470 [Myxococcaceae bacterium]
MSARRAVPRAAGRLEQVDARLLQADAVSGLASAPLLFEIRGQAVHRFSSSLRGQLSYTFTRYVSNEGSAHIVATKWSVRLWKRWRFWAAVAGQYDVLHDSEGATSSFNGLATFGIELAIR